MLVFYYAALVVGCVVIGVWMSRRKLWWKSAAIFLLGLGITVSSVALDTNNRLLMLVSTGILIGAALAMFKGLKID